MQGESDQYPERFVKSRGKIQFRFHIEEKSTETDTGSRTSYRFEYVEADAATRESILEAMADIDGAAAILDSAGEIVVTTEPIITTEKELQAVKLADSILVKD